MQKPARKQGRNIQLERNVLAYARASALIERLHHQKTIFAIIVILADTLDDCIARSAIKVLGSDVADADLEHYCPDLTLSER